MLALGVVFVVLAMLLIVAEAHVTSGGLIGVGAALALIAGVALLLSAGALTARGVGSDRASTEAFGQSNSELTTASATGRA